MGIQEKSILIKHPKIMRTLLSMGFLILSMIFMFSASYVGGFSFYFSIIWSFALFLIVVFLFNRLLRVKNITLGDNYIISINKKTYDANQIRVILVDGERVGVKVAGKKLVPLDLYFSFKKDTTDYGVEEIREWAKRNNKPIKNKFFFGWI